MDKSSEKNQEFELKVNDRRPFDQEGREKPTAEENPTQEQKTSTTEDASQAKEAPASSEKAPEKDQQTSPPPTSPDFHSLILSLAMNAQSSLGMLPEPGTGKTHQDLKQAKQVIDWLGALEEKTKGNLSGEETQMLSTLLYQLRVLYLDQQKKSGEKPNESK